MIGRQLGNFELVDELGGGAWGKVYRARQVTLGGRLVAVKVLWPHLAADERARQRFLDEAHNMARLSHSNVVKVIDVGEQDDTYYFAMEYIEGESLSEATTREGSMAPGRVAEIGAQIADALGHAHSRGIIHRDIKPANILLDAEGRPIVTDFGIAKVGEGSGLTATGMSIGTPEYMSPEQAKGNPVDGRSDIYSLGVVLYQMVCGQAPFTATTPFAVGMKHINEAPRAPREVRPDCPEWLATIIMRALAKEPFDRFGTAQEMAARLRAARPVASPTVEMPSTAATEGTIAAPNYATSPPVTTAAVLPQVARPRPNWAVAAVVLGIVVILGLMLGIGVLMSSRSPVTPPLPPPGPRGGGAPPGPTPVSPPVLPPTQDTVTVPSVSGSYVFPDSDRRLLTEHDLRNKSNWTLTIARNEIYARRGRPFATPAIRAYFRQQTWYNPLSCSPEEFDDALLNSVESRNTVRIREYQVGKFGSPAKHP